MIGEKPDFDTFITEHRWAVLTTLRKSGHPSSSVVAYAREGDTLVVSTPGTTFKRASLDRDPRMTLCIISNAEPFNFVTVEGRVDVETAGIKEATRLVFANIADAGWREPDNLDEWLTTQQRVILRLHPQRVSGVIR